ncbi:MAG: helix-turn-helix transcriptional regulator [Ignavibacteriae bacterium]|nr:helix-turn-helix transcriptional regulator [Ignavibacteriota bacterium]
MDRPADIARIVKFHRKKAGLSQQELAKLAGIGKTAVFDLEKGKETIQLDTLKKVLYVLNIKMTFDSPLMKDFEAEAIDEEG